MTPLNDAWRPIPGTPWAAAASKKGGWASSAGGKARDAFSGGEGVPIPFVDYNSELADVSHYCKAYNVMCEKSPAARLAFPRDRDAHSGGRDRDAHSGGRDRDAHSGGRDRDRDRFTPSGKGACTEAFVGLTDEELADVFVPVARPQVSASFLRAGDDDPLTPPLLLNPGVPGGDPPFA